MTTPLMLTVPTESTVTRVRGNFAADLLALHIQVTALQATLHLALYGDPSKLGADRARLDVAGRLLNEVAATLTDLTYMPKVDSGEEG